MAIDKIPGKRGVSYRVRVKLPSGRRISKCFSRKVDAEKFEAELRAGMRSEKQVERISFSELCDKFAALHLSLQEFSTRQRYESIIKKYLRPRFENVFIDQISKVDVSTFLSDLHQFKISDSSKNFIFVALQSILKKAVEWEFLNKSPTTGMKPPRKGQGRMDYWSPSEIQKFLNFHAGSERLPLYMIALNTGLRLGEIVGLLWDCVDFERGLLTVRRTWCQKSRKLKDTTKTHKARIVGISADLLECLLILRKRRSIGHVLLAEEMGLNDFSHMARAFRRDCERAKVRTIRFHDLRHTFATQFVASGGSIHALSGILGHTTESMTARYAHFGPEHAQAAAKVVSFGVAKASNVIQFPRSC